MRLAILFGFISVSLVLGQIRHDKESILKTGHDMVSLADATIAELAKSGKSYDTRALKNEQTALHKLIAELEAATEPSAVSRIGEATHQMELTVAREINKISSLFHGPPDF